MNAMTDEQREKTAFVFFDNKEYGGLGSSFFKKRYEDLMKDKVLINFDCVADGDKIMVIQNDEAMKRYAEIADMIIK